MIGLPDEVYGEEICAVFVAKEGIDFPSEERFWPGARNIWAGTSARGGSSWWRSGRQFGQRFGRHLGQHSAQRLRLQFSRQFSRKLSQAGAPPLSRPPHDSGLRWTG